MALGPWTAGTGGGSCGPLEGQRDPEEGLTVQVPGEHWAGRHLPSSGSGSTGAQTVGRGVLAGGLRGLAQSRLDGEHLASCGLSTAIHTEGAGCFL